MSFSTLRVIGILQSLILSCVIVTQVAAQDIVIHNDPRFNSVAWMQTAAEYQLLARQSYRLAQYQMNIGLSDGHWSADEVQVAEGGYFGKPAAVILDLDETVLDNSAYNARNIIEKTEYTQENWNAWCNEEKARLIPGACDFLKAANALGVKVFFITNRRDEVKAATINNLKMLGICADEHNVLTRNDAAGRGGDKLSRRAMVARGHRIILLIGDNLSDICSEMEVADHVLRSATANRKADFLGTRWIVLPNPIYGSWERALPKGPASALRTDRDPVALPK
jgi:5'-nucleotidase (lipoprotein e(P4) family)